MRFPASHCLTLPPAVVRSLPLVGRHLVLFVEQGGYLATDDVGLTCVRELLAGRSLGEAWRQAQPGLDRRGFEGLVTRLVTASRQPGPVDPPTAAAPDLKFDLTFACDAACVHCFLPESRPPHELSDADWLRIGELALAGCAAPPAVAISGGEPLLREGLVRQLVERLAGRAESVTLMTNGGRLADGSPGAREALEFLLGHGVELQLSLDGFTAAVHDGVRGPRRFTALVRLIEQVAGRGVALHLHTTVSRLNLADVEANFLPFLARGLQAPRIHYSFSLVRPVGRGRRLAEQGLLCTPLEFERMLYRLYAAVAGGGWRTAVGRPRPARTICAIGRQLTISPDGSCQVCGVPGAEQQGQLPAEGVALILARQAALRDRCHQRYCTPCHACDLRGFCHGGCRVVNRSETGSYVTPRCDAALAESRAWSLLRAAEFGELL